MQIKKRPPAAKRFPMPAGSPVESVTIRELFGVDEREVAAMVDALADPSQGTAAIIRAEKQEGIRRSITELDGHAVPPDVPLFEIDKWARVPSKALERFFGVVNGLRQVEIDKTIAEGAPVWDEESGRAGKRFRLPERCSLDVVTVWEIGGNDEIRAAMAVDKVGEVGRAVAGVLHRRELVRGSLGNAGTDLDFDALSMRTSMALSLLFDAVNAIPEEEISGCVAAAVDVSGVATAETAEPPHLRGEAATG